LYLVEVWAGAVGASARHNELVLLSKVLVAGSVFGRPLTSFDSILFILTLK
jgi:hypothetical protein